MHYCFAALWRWGFSSSHFLCRCMITKEKLCYVFRWACIISLKGPVIYTVTFCKALQFTVGFRQWDGDVCSLGVISVVKRGFLMAELERGLITCPQWFFFNELPYGNATIMFMVHPVSLHWSGRLNGLAVWTCNRFQPFSVTSWLWQTLRLWTAAVCFCESYIMNHNNLFSSIPVIGQLDA